MKAQTLLLSMALPAMLHGQDLTAPQHADQQPITIQALQESGLLLRESASLGYGALAFGLAAGGLAYYATQVADSEAGGLWVGGGICALGSIGCAFGSQAKKAKAGRRLMKK